MRIFCSVAAEFWNHKTGEKIFSVGQNDLLALIDAPDEIMSDNLFNLLVADGSLKVVNTVTDKKQLENNPTMGLGADGKAIADETGEGADNKTGAGRGRKAKEE